MTGAKRRAGFVPGMPVSFREVCVVGTLWSDAIFAASRRRAGAKSSTFCERGGVAGDGDAAEPRMAKSLAWLAGYTWRSSKNSDAGATLVTSKWSRARVHAT